MLPRHNTGSVLLFPAHQSRFPGIHKPTAKPTPHSLGLRHTSSLGTHFCISEGGRISQLLPQQCCITNHSGFAAKQPPRCSHRSSEGCCGPGTGGSGAPPRPSERGGPRWRTWSPRSLHACHQRVGRGSHTAECKDQERGTSRSPGGRGVAGRREILVQGSEEQGSREVKSPPTHRPWCDSADLREASFSLAKPQERPQSGGGLSSHLCSGPHADGNQRSLKLPSPAATG